MNIIDNALFRSADFATPFPIEPEFDTVYASTISSSQGSSDVETLSVTTSFQKQVGDHTDLRLDLVFNESATETYSAATLTTSGRGELSYDIGAVDALGGEQRALLVAENVGLNTPRNQERYGDGIIGGVFSTNGNLIIL